MEDKYWAASYSGKDYEPELVGVLDEKVRKYQRALRGSTHWRRVLRNIRYFHGNFYPQAGDSINFEIKHLDSGHLGVGVNHYRNILEQIFLIATGDKIAFKTRAINTDNISTDRAQLGDGILDYYVREQRANQYFKTAALHALVMNSGYLMITWDPSLGQLVDGDLRTKEQYFQGDFIIDNPTIADVAHDIGTRSWRKIQWTVVRSPVNKWDLAAKFPKKKDQIISQVRDKQSDLWFYQGLNFLADDDVIYKYDFFHKSTPALPGGRHVTYIPGNILVDQKNPYVDNDNPHTGIPLFRCVHGEFLMNCLGYSVGNDLQSLQECENGAISAISTILAAHGVGHIWQRPGDKMKARNLEGGLRTLISHEEPKAINFTSIPPELWKATDLYIRAMEYLSGINAVRRGQPEANLRTGKALQIVAAQAVEAASNYAESFQEMCEDAGTHMLRCIRKFGRGSRTTMIIGKNNQHRQRSWEPQELEAIDRVVVDKVNPLAGTILGRLAMADDLASKQLIANYRQYIHLATTGNIEPLLEFEQSQLNLVREENERLSQGTGVLPLPTHPHVLHIKEHSVIVSNLENAGNANIRDLVIAHIMQHVDMWLNPNPQVQALQAALSNEPPPFLPPPQAPGAPGAPMPPPEANNPNVIPMPPGGGPPLPEGNNPMELA